MFIPYCYSFSLVSIELRLAKASPQSVRRIKNNLGSSERFSNGRVQSSEGNKRNSLIPDGNMSLQPKQQNWSNRSHVPNHHGSEEYHIFTGSGRINPPRQQDRHSKIRRPHVYEDVDTTDDQPVPQPHVPTDSHARTRSWVESHNERRWVAEDVERSDSAEGYRRGEVTGSMWATRNREGQQPRGSREKKQPRMTRLGRGHLPTAFAPPPMTVESEILGSSYHHSTRTSSMPATHLQGIGSTSRRMSPAATGTLPVGSKRISYGMAVGVSPIDMPIQIRESGHGRRDVDRNERFSSSEHYTSRARARSREEAWQTDGYSPGHRSHSHTMYPRQYGSLQRQMSPPQHPYQPSRRRSSESNGDGYGIESGAYIIQDQEHYRGYSGSRGRIVPQRTYSSDIPHQRLEGVGPSPIPNRESYL